MAKRTAVRNESTRTDGINPRQACPCGSGKRYKACHGLPDAQDIIVARPFVGLAGECELVALREFVPSATVSLPVRSGEPVTLATVLPMAAAGLCRGDGRRFVGLQTQVRSGDIAADLAGALHWVATAEPGAVLPVVGADLRASADRLTELIDGDAELEIEVHKDFSWWVPGDLEPTGEVAMSLERANQAIMQTERLEADGVSAAYWVDAREKAHLRWVRPEPEERLLPALARLAARDELGLGENTRFAGSFRAHGLLVPVWDLDPESHAREWAQPAAELGKRLAEALASLDSEPLTEPERRARDGLRGRQVTLR